MKHLLLLCVLLVLFISPIKCHIPKSKLYKTTSSTKDSTSKSIKLVKTSKKINHKDDPSLDIGVIASSNTNTKQQSGIPWYTNIIPIYPNEIPKFLSLSFMMFWIVFIFTMTRDTKDALIVTNCGAEAIAFLKVYGVIPAATLFMIGYAHLSNIFSPRALFYITIAPFILFYFLFAFILYPMRNILHPMSIKVPVGGLSYAVNLLRHWTFSLYYIISELWGSAGIPLLFWTCANDVIKIDQAKRIYPLIVLIGNLGPILSGVTMSLVSKKIKETILNDELGFEVSLKILTIFMTLAGLIVGGLHWLTHHLNDKELQTIESSSFSTTMINKNKSNDHKNKKNSNIESTKKNIKAKKPKLSFIESLKVLISDSYLCNVAIMVLSYGLTMEFTEIIWKASVKKAFPIKTDYLNFMGTYSTLVGIAAFLMMFVGTNIVKTLGWRAGALMTPSIMGLLALPFFISIISGGLQGSHKTLLVAVYIGTIQNILSKATKYAVFDPTKEMTYIPLDQDSKTKGKAAIDVLGARIGKSGGALAQQILVLMFGSIMKGAPILAALFYFVIFAWIKAVNDLSPMFIKKTKEIEKN